MPATRPGPARPFSALDGRDFNDETSLNYKDGEVSAGNAKLALASKESLLNQPFIDAVTHALTTTPPPAQGIQVFQQAFAFELS
ncbi:MAG: hypothetical protein JO006_17025 [Paucibacter sp.]|nr:hypothetical protein [Roseateles sp.]